MWICLNKAFLSIVTPNTDPDTSELLVRARREGDIEAVFPDAVVSKTPHRDYLFRAYIAREAVAEALAREAMGVNYHNFKDSVRNRPLHDAFARVWGIMAGLQETAPYSGGRRRSQREFGL